MVKENKNYINGKWVRSESDKVSIDINPAYTNDVRRLEVLVPGRWERQLLISILS